MATLQAGPLRLEPMVVGHAEALYPVLADPRLYVFMDHGPPASSEALASVYRRLEARRSPDGSEGWLNWALIDPEGQACGFVQATVLPDGRAWIAYVLAHSHWGRGWARQATEAMLEHLGLAYGVQRFMASVEQANLRSLRLLDALGFALAGPEELARHTLSPTECLLVRPAGPNQPPEDLVLR